VLPIPSQIFLELVFNPIISTNTDYTIIHDIRWIILLRVLDHTMTYFATVIKPIIEIIYFCLPYSSRKVSNFFCRCGFFLYVFTCLLIFTFVKESRNESFICLTKACVCHGGRVKQLPATFIYSNKFTGQEWYGTAGCHKAKSDVLVWDQTHNTRDIIFSHFSYEFTSWIWREINKGNNYYKREMVTHPSYKIPSFWPWTDFLPRGNTGLIFPLPDDQIIILMLRKNSATPPPLPLPS
jgi:hypothetical protein